MASVARLQLAANLSKSPQPNVRVKVLGYGHIAIESNNGHQIPAQSGRKYYENG